eukprot:2214199-Alexandrium_andersonii.AAC.1
MCIRDRPGYGPGNERRGDRCDCAASGLHAGRGGGQPSSGPPQEAARGGRHCWTGHLGVDGRGNGGHGSGS